MSAIQDPAVNSHEVEAYAVFLNRSLHQDPLCDEILPLDPKDVDAFFEAFKDGLLLTALVNLAIPDTVPSQQTQGYESHKGRRRNSAVAYDTVIRVINGLRKSDKIQLPHFDAADVVNGVTKTVLPLVWQLIRVSLLSLVNLTLHPELMQMVEDDELIAPFYSKPPEDMLMRWVNYHMIEAGSSLRITNFGKDLQNCDVYEVLLDRVGEGVAAPMRGETSLARAEEVVNNARRLGVQDVLTRASDIESMDKKMNLALLVQIFNEETCMPDLTEAEIERLIAIAKEQGAKLIAQDLRALLAHITERARRFDDTMSTMSIASPMSIEPSPRLKTHSEPQTMEEWEAQADKDAHFSSDDEQDAVRDFENVDYESAGACGLACNIGLDNFMGGIFAPPQPVEEEAPLRRRSYTQLQKSFKRKDRQEAVHRAQLEDDCVVM